MRAAHRGPIEPRRTAPRRGAAASSCALLAAVAALTAPNASADHASLYRGPGPRPGPAALYQRLATAPQLTNSGIWRARAILISGASAYRDGEFLYQDFLYDDHGARAAPDPGDKRAGGDLFSPPNGTYTYPTSRVYAGDAADLVELRVRPQRRSTAFRITLNTLLAPSRVAATIAIGSSVRPRPLPHGANASAPAALFLTWHGATADLVDAASGRTLATRPAVRVDLRRRQIQLTVPHSAWNPGRRVVRLAAGVGLWDVARGRYLVPGARADATRPGGAGGLAHPTAFFNVAFRHAEPFQSLPDLAPGAPLNTSALSDPAWWRDRLQGAALRTGDLGRFHAEVDFAKLAARRDDDMTGRPQGVPRTGIMDRILASHVETRQGTDYTTTCGAASYCRGELRGRLQPYAIYVPRRPRGRRYAFTLLLHSLTANYNQFAASRNIRQFAARGGGSIVITPEGRGPDGFYRDDAGRDTFEAWADVAAHYRLDPSRTVISGYSMGGFGTFKLAEQYPDLFARAQPTVGTNPLPARQLGSLRWVPLLAWNGRADELVPLPGPRASAAGLARLGYRYELDVFDPVSLVPFVPTPQHLMLALNDQFTPAAAFLDDARVIRNPPRVSFVYGPAGDGRRANHAYWVSGLALRRAGAGTLGSIDVRSGGFGLGDPRASGTRHSRGSLRGGKLGPRGFDRSRQTWSRLPRRPVRDLLTIRAENISTVTINAARARVSCRARLSIHSDGPLRVRLTGCPRRLPAPPARGRG